MDFRPLRAFIEVVRQGGFSSAAKTVCATQSTVSKAVKQLEDEIGLRLLDRIGHRSVMTAAGEVVYRRGLKLLADRDDLMAEIDEIRGVRRGALRLGLPPVGSSTIFAPLFAIYRQRFPGIEVRLTEYGSDQLASVLHAGEIDFAGALLPVSGEFEFQPVRREPLVALLPPGHPLADAASVTMLDLKDTPFVLFASGFALHRMVMDACRRSGFEPDIVARSGQTDFMVELVGTGLGVTFLPRMIAARYKVRGLCHVALDEPDAEWNMAMVWRRGAWLSPAAQAWLDLVRETHGRVSWPDNSPATERNSLRDMSESGHFAIPGVNES
ncbi:LysR family transcriptional regulator [Rhizobium sp. YJ-22]|nr:LysR family transcriptional regulator [Rhizobium sp. YJ-22]MDG3576506.1 LysR family transcriptional regulator [Rhizobium sp. YJ-22]